MQEAGGGLPAPGGFDLLKIPGAVRAIARLVTGVGDAGAAWLEALQAKGESVTSQIRSDTEAKKQLSAALAQKAMELAVGDPDLVRRSMTRWAEVGTRQQANVESIAIKTKEDLAADPPPADTVGPSDDWLNYFEAHAANASSEAMRDIWSRILAGEIRKPGAFSLRTLQMMSVLDTRDATNINSVLPFIINGCCIPMEFARINGWGQKLIELEQMGFGTGSSGELGITLQTDENKRIYVTTETEVLIVEYFEDRVLPLPGFILSSTGTELSALLQGRSKLEEVAQIFWATQPERMLLGKLIDKQSGRYDRRSLVELYNTFGG